MRLPALTTNHIGIASALAASFSFTINDAAIKFLSGDYPLHQIVFCRAVIALIITIAFIMPLDGGRGAIKTQKLKLHFIRGGLVVLANSFFFAGLAAIPLSEATALFFVAPVVITLFSVIFLGEKVGKFRWGATILGLAGAVIMLRPTSDSFQLAAILPIIAAVCYAGLHIMSRTMGGTERASTMSVYVNLTFIIVGVVMGSLFGAGQFGNSGNASVDFIFRAWVMPASDDWIVLGTVGLASCFGGFFISQAYRICEVALIAPFEYVALVLAIIWGIVFFDEWPDTIAWLGTFLILVSGLVVVWRETVLKRRQSPPMSQQR